MSITAPTFTWVADLVRTRAAIRLEPGKEYLVEARLTSLARELGHKDVDTLVCTLRTSTDASLKDRVVEALTTNETSWFRDVAPFKVLTDTILPSLPGAGQVRVWSAACSTGQEPYSIAMTLTDWAAATGRDYAILATDLDRVVLARAETGRYSQVEVNRGLPAPHLVRHFTRNGADWQVSPALARHIRFAQHNLLNPAPPGGPFHVVFLRNVLIYFDTPTKRAVLNRVAQAITPGGYLVLGAAETTLGVDDTWHRIPAGRTFVYQPPTTGGSR